MMIKVQGWKPNAAASIEIVLGRRGSFRHCTSIALGTVHHDLRWSKVGGWAWSVLGLKGAIAGFSVFLYFWDLAQQMNK